MFCAFCNPCADSNLVLDKMLTSQSCIILNKEKYDKIILYLTNKNSQQDKNFKGWLNRKKFVILKIPGKNEIYSLV